MKNTSENFDLPEFENPQTKCLFCGKYFWPDKEKQKFCDHDCLKKYNKNLLIEKRKIKK